MKTKNEHILTFSDKMQISTVSCFATCDWFCLMTSFCLFHMVRFQAKTLKSWKDITRSRKIRLRVHGTSKHSYGRRPEKTGNISGK